jgi:hypothetical protein
MQPRHIARKVLLQLLAQVVGKQAVVAPGGQFAGHRRQKQVVGVQLLQEGRAVDMRVEGGAHRGVELPQDAGAQQKATDVGTLAGQHVFGQVVGHRPVGARKPRYKIFRVDRAVQGHGRQPQCGHPAFGFLVQAKQLVGAELVRVGPLLKKAGRVLQAEAQAIGVDLDQLAAHPQPGQADLRQAARADHQQALAWQVVGDFAHDVQQSRFVDGFKLVQKQCKRRVDAGQGLHRVVAGQAQLAHGSVQTVQKPRDVVVGPVQREPGGGDTRVFQPHTGLHHGGGFAKTGRGPHQHQLACAPADRLAQACTRHLRGVVCRRVELALQPQRDRTRCRRAGQVVGFAWGGHGGGSGQTKGLGWA